MIQAMDIEFDPAKDSINRTKHGLSLAYGLLVIEGTIKDIPRPAGLWWRAAASCVRTGRGGRLFVCAYTVRGQVRRVISVRKANERERRQCLGS